MKIKVSGIKKKAPRTKEVSIGGGNSNIGGEDFIEQDHGTISVAIDEGRRRIRELV